MKEYKINGKTYKLIIDTNSKVETFKKGGKQKKKGLIIGFQSGGKSVSYRGTKYTYDETKDKFYNSDGKEATVPGYIRDSLIQAAVPIKEVADTPTLEVADDSKIFNLKSNTPKINSTGTTPKTPENSIEEDGTIFKLPGDNTYTYMKKGDEFSFFNTKEGDWKPITDKNAITKLDNFTKGIVDPPKKDASGGFWRDTSKDTATITPNKDNTIPYTNDKGATTSKVEVTGLNTLRWDGYEEDMQAIRTENAQMQLLADKYLKEQARNEKDPEYIKAREQAEAKRLTLKRERDIRNERIESFRKSYGTAGGRSRKQETEQAKAQYDEVQKIKNEQNISYDKAKKIYEFKKDSIRNIRRELEDAEMKKLRDAGNDTPYKDLDLVAIQKQAEAIYAEQNNPNSPRNRQRKMFFNFKYKNGGKAMARRKKYGKGGTVQELRNKLYKK